MTARREARRRARKTRGGAKPEKGKQMSLNDIKISENFSLREFQCPCCHAVMIHPRLAAALQQLRGARGKPVVITSGYRCARHNAEVGGVPRSRHTRGLAADIAAPRAEQERLRELARKAGFTKIILYPERNFIHLEINDD